MIIKILISSHHNFDNIHQLICEIIINIILACDFSLEQEGGPIALVRDGDVITIDVEKRAIDMAVSDEELSLRKDVWAAPPLKATRGTLYKVRVVLVSRGWSVGALQACTMCLYKTKIVFVASNRTCYCV